MIRDENARMLGQVEDVLRISSLEKNELDLPKEHTLIYITSLKILCHI